ncbi:hypothetical protein, partial [Micrococcus luteus]|uniref:hypothetical protein n=1 Tax=Micrococcus luteus TaxID=1270 RepID=UPI001C92F5C2
MEVGVVGEELEMGESVMGFVGGEVGERVEEGGVREGGEEGEAAVVGGVVGEVGVGVMGGWWGVWGVGDVMGGEG